MQNFKIFDSLLEPVFILDDQLRVTYCNEAAAAICNISVRKLSRNMHLTQALEFSEVPSFLQSSESLVTVSDATPYVELSFSTVAKDRSGKAQITCQIYDEKKWIIFFRDVTLEETLQKKYRAELEQVQHYSKNLEKLVAERTSQIQELNKTMKALLNSLNQGFFIFNSEGQCLDVYSLACETVLECAPPGKQVWEVLRLPEWEVEDFKKWTNALFSELMPFNDLVPLGPSFYNHSQGLKVQLEFYPLVSEAKKLEAVVVVGTDISKLVAAQEEANLEKANAKMILSLVKYKRQIHSFLDDTGELLSTLFAELEKKDGAHLKNIFRCLHTIKGGAALYSINNLVTLCHQAEEALASIQREGFAYTSWENLLVLAKSIQGAFEEFMTENSSLIGKPVGSSHRGAGMRMDRRIEIGVSQFQNFQVKLRGLDMDLADEFDAEFLTEPIINSFEHYNTVVETVAQATGKLVAPLQFSGETLKINPDPYQELFGSAVHVFRNAVDHGIESPEEREFVGKRTEGHIQVRFFKKPKDEKAEDFNLVIEIVDDGRGIDPQKIRDKLLQKNIATNQLSDAEVIQHVFDSQFSTKEEVTEISGRGVGMDAVAHCAEKLGGRAWVRSELGKGTHLVIEVPFILKSILRPQFKVVKAV